jgi:hypothetical protein
MHSIRELILRELVARCTTAVAPALVLRFPTIPVTREASPALLLFVEGDTITAHANAIVDRQLIVRLVALARGDDAFDTTDRLVVAAHAALMADTNLSGLALGLREIDCEWDAEDADAGAAATPARYEIRYRTLAADLTRHG